MGNKIIGKLFGLIILMLTAACQSSNPLSCLFQTDGIGEIAYISGGVSNQDIYVMDADGCHPIKLTKNMFVTSDPVWSPDGQKIAFVQGLPFAMSYFENKEIYTINADGSNLVNLTNHPEQDSTPGLVTGWAKNRLYFKS